MAKDESDDIIVRSTIALAHNMGLKVTAEGVESQDILVFLYIVWLGWCAARLGNRYRRMGITMIFFLLLQLLLGMAAVVFNLPLVVVTAHNAIAALLLLSVVNLYHHLTPRTRIL